jgi:hypothetical protein
MAPTASATDVAVANSASTAWSEKSGDFTTPPNAATLRLRSHRPASVATPGGGRADPVVPLYEQRVIAWDDVALSGPAVATQYYYAGGQRVAMRENGTLYWLLTDHPTLR